MALFESIDSCDTKSQSQSQSESQSQSQSLIINLIPSQSLIKFPQEGDLWAIGVILFEMLFGFPPFAEVDEADLTTDERAMEAAKIAVRGSRYEE